MSVATHPDAHATIHAVQVRPMRSDDMDAVSEMFSAAGEDALHDRFFTLGVRMVSEHLLELASPHRPRCLVAVADGEIVGIVEMAEVGTQTEEVAFLVAAGWHHRGIGTMLLTAALADARLRGVRTLVAEVLAANHLMLDIFTDVGATLSRQGIDVRVTVPIEEPAAEHEQSSTLRRQPVDTQVLTNEEVPS
jgi:GNAT superfamily N-acetyltransferase